MVDATWGTGEAPRDVLGPVGGEPAFDGHHPPSAELVADCVHCGFCLPACPTYVLWGNEADSPRGRIHLIAQGLGGEPLSDSMVEHFDSCLGCLSCVTACPSGVRYDRLIEDTRAQVERRHDRPVRERLLRRAIFALFPYPRRLRLLRAPLAAYRKSGLQHLIFKSGLLERLSPTLATLNSLTPAPRNSQTPAALTLQTPTARDSQTPAARDSQTPTARDSQMPAARDSQTPAARDSRVRAALNSLAPAVRRIAAPAGRVRAARRVPAPPERVRARGAKRATVGMLTGCVQSAFFPQVNSATVRVLAAEGCEVLIPRGQGCCGALSVHTGRADEARRFARRLIDTFERTGMDYLVVNAAGCGSSLKEYDVLLAGDPAYAAKAREFTARVRDLSELLDELGPRATRHPLPVTAAYHDACHLGHAQGVRDQPRRLLRGIPGLELREIADPDICCGSAGVWNILNPRPAAELGDRKARAVLATGASLLVTANPGCLMQVAAAVRRAGGQIRPAHTAEVLDASIRDLGTI